MGWERTSSREKVVLAEGSIVLWLFLETWGLWMIRTCSTTATIERRAEIIRTCIPSPPQDQSCSVKMRHTSRRICERCLQRATKKRWIVEIRELFGTFSLTHLIIKQFWTLRNGQNFHQNYDLFLTSFVIFCCRIVKISGIQSFFIQRSNRDSLCVFLPALVRSLWIPLTAVWVPRQECTYIHVSCRVVSNGSSTSLLPCVCVCPSPSSMPHLLLPLRRAWTHRPSPARLATHRRWVGGIFCLH